MRGDLRKKDLQKCFRQVHSDCAGQRLSILQQVALGRVVMRYAVILLAPRVADSARDLPRRTARAASRDMTMGPRPGREDPAGSRACTA